jgi:hypothetical protein
MASALIVDHSSTPRLIAASRPVTNLGAIKIGVAKNIFHRRWSLLAVSKRQRVEGPIERRPLRTAAPR